MKGLAGRWKMNKKNVAMAETKDGEITKKEARLTLISGQSRSDKAGVSAAQRRGPWDGLPVLVVGFLP